MNRVLQADLSLENDKQESNTTQENIKRSIVKTISWRVVGTLATVTISYLVTGTLALAFSIGGIELVSKMVLYFFHERTWNSIKWGK
ncbi:MULTISPECIES: DUF2061 domain-containing protein [Winogradskyella]|jgi:uncharacterized membrane protein|uniref:Uncharacterized membrane protein n=2 Tax=Winogradskyella TaxID=286104 RepID=A0A1G8K137_9FLAO|nr:MULTISPECIES: DUF2061 domain-containing protein [Winogradskyella]REE08030.1 putative membrane protein [Winogradskyella pacifica]SDI37103.1 Uncharacterized membrane protein [Winogradskyella thalassocola]